MADIYHYMDYRTYLRDAYLDLKKTRPSGFTHRRIGQKGGFDPGLFSKVIQGQRNISEKLVPGFCKAFGLSGDEARYFHCLVRFNQADSEAERRELEHELAAFPGRAGRDARMVHR
jgi:uncharacterized protein (TIGR02147 family)